MELLVELLVERKVVNSFLVVILVRIERFESLKKMEMWGLSLSKWRKGMRN